MVNVVLNYINFDASYRGVFHYSEDVEGWELPLFAQVTTSVFILGATTRVFWTFNLKYTVAFTFTCNRQKITSSRAHRVIH